jgi:hypothetical protein
MPSGGRRSALALSIIGQAPTSFLPLSFIAGNNDAFVLDAERIWQ